MSGPEDAMAIIAARVDAKRIAYDRMREALHEAILLIRRTVGREFMKAEDQDALGRWAKVLEEAPK